MVARWSRICEQVSGRSGGESSAPGSSPWTPVVPTPTCGRPGLAPRPAQDLREGGHHRRRSRCGRPPEPSASGRPATRRGRDHRPGADPGNCGPGPRRCANLAAADAVRSWVRPGRWITDSRAFSLRAADGCPPAAWECATPFGYPRAFGSLRSLTRSGLRSASARSGRGSMMPSTSNRKAMQKVQGPYRLA